MRSKGLPLSIRLIRSGGNGKKLQRLMLVRERMINIS
jgi:hypothetical protein